MVRLDVHELRNYKDGTTSELTKSYLAGIILTVPEESGEYEQGTLLLQDVVTYEPIPCSVDRLHPRLHNTVLYIKKWNYINCNSDGVEYIEFLLDDAYSTDHLSASVLKESLNLDNRALQVSLDRKAIYYQLEHIKQGIPSDTINVAGIIESISVLYTRPKKPAIFFVQIVADTSALQQQAISVMFCGNNLIQYYWSFQIGSAYAFQHLQLASISGNRTKRKLLSFIPIKSSYQAITFMQLKGLPKPPSFTASHSLTLNTVHKHRTYTGNITRVIDSMFGIYELDHHIIVCLFNYFGYSPTKPYRPSTRIRLHHVHFATIKAEDGKTSYLLDYVWKAKRSEQGYVAIVGCMKSHIDTLVLPQHCDFVETTTPFILANNKDVETQIKEYIYIDCLRRHSTFKQLIRQLEMYAALVIKFMDAKGHGKLSLDLESFKTAYSAVRQQVFATTQTRTMRSSNMTSDFFLHDLICLTVGPQTLDVVMDAYPSVADIYKYMSNSLENYHLELAGSNSLFEKEHVLTRRAIYQQTKNYSIIAAIQVAKDGRLYITDGITKVLLTIASESSETIPKSYNGVYLVRRLQMYEEDLSFMEDRNENTMRKKKLTHTYCVCHDHDLVFLGGGMEGKTLFQVDVSLEEPQLVPDRYSLLQAPENTALPTEHQYVVAHVVARHPMQVYYSSDSTICLECRVVVELFSIEGVDNQSDHALDLKGMKKCILAFTSRAGSIVLNQDFQVGTRWIIYGLDKEGSKMPVSSKFSGGGSTFIIKMDQHTIYPLLFKKASSANAVQLQPHYSQQQMKKDNTNIVFGVSAFANLKEAPQGLRNTTTSTGFYEEIVHLRGVVITKRFLDGFETDGILGKHATKLFETLGISTGKPSRKVYIQLRQPDSLDTADIYMDLHKVPYPSGLVVGATVTFFNLTRKQRRKQNTGFFFLADACTHMQVHSMEPSPEMVSMKPKHLDIRLISSLIDSVQGQPEEGKLELFKLFCYVQSILVLTLRWECRDCGSIVRNNECYGLCKDAPRVFLASAFVEISDGTASANASIDSERIIFRLLQLSKKQIDALRNIVARHGELTYGGWGAIKSAAMEDVDEQMNRDIEIEQREAMYGYTLEDLCYNAKKAGQFWLYGQNVSSLGKRKKSDKESFIDEFGLRRFTVSDNGRLLRTLGMTKAKVKVVDIAFPEARTVAYEMLQKLNGSNETSVLSLSMPSSSLDFV